MFRRNFLRMFGLGSATGLWAGGTSTAPAPPTSQVDVEPPSMSVGSLDLSTLAVIDTHVHPPQRMTLSESYLKWNDSFVDAMLPPYDFSGKAELRGKLAREFIEQIWSLPRQTGYNNYMARVHGIPPTPEAFDSVVAKHITSDKAFTAYITSILDRERVRAVVLQSADTQPAAPRTFIPGDRFVWTYAITHLIHPQWARQQRLTALGDVVASIDRTLDTAAANGAVGFKSAAAYFRPLGLGQTDRQRAETAFKTLLAAEPKGYVAQNAPYYGDPVLDSALRTYQDFLLKRIFVRAGELTVPMIIHTAVGLHPALRFDYNDPLELYHVFQDDEIRQAATSFVLIHSGYPQHHVVAAMLTQFPNVFADVSFYSKFPGVLEEVYRVFLSFAPPQKVMHGSDSNNVPEEIGYCASNTRRTLARVLRDFKTHYGWSQADCERIARSVLTENARRVFKIRAS